MTGHGQHLEELVDVVQADDFAKAVHPKWHIGLSELSQVLTKALANFDYGRRAKRWLEQLIDLTQQPSVVRERKQIDDNGMRSARQLKRGRRVRSSRLRLSVQAKEYRMEVVAAIVGTVAIPAVATHTLAAANLGTGSGGGGGG